MIIDAHAHLGWDEVFDEDFPAAALLESQARNGIGLTLVQPALVHDLETVRRYHDAIAALAAAHPGRFRGIANPNPHLPAGRYEDEVRRCVTALGFAGVKIHPLAHAVNPAGRHGRRVFALAAELKIPVMVHTGVGVPWACPALVEDLAAEHPETPVILAHAGAMFAAEAFQLARRRENVYLELSWQAYFHIRDWVNSLGAPRLMFGSDHADNADNELGKIRALGLAAAEEDMLLGGTAAGVFGM